MAKLILSLDDLVLQEIPLTKERTTIGRKPHNDIQIDNLAVSGEHAVIVTIMNDCILEDLGSTNGTLVNGVLAKKHIPAVSIDTRPDLGSVAMVVRANNKDYGLKACEFLGTSLKGNGKVVMLEVK